MAYGEGYHVDTGGRIVERFYTEPFDYDRLAEVCFISQPTVFLCTEVIKTIGLLDINLHYSLDYEYWMRVAQQFRVGYLPTFLAKSRIHIDAKTLSQKDICRAPAGALQISVSWERPVSLQIYFGDHLMNTIILKGGTFTITENLSTNKLSTHGGQYGEVKLYVDDKLNPSPGYPQEPGTLSYRINQPSLYQVKKLIVHNNKGEKVVLFSGCKALFVLFLLPGLILCKSLTVNRRFPLGRSVRKGVQLWTHLTRSLLGRTNR